MLGLGVALFASVGLVYMGFVCSCRLCSLLVSVLVFVIGLTDGYS